MDDLQRYYSAQPGLLAHAHMECRPNRFVRIAPQALGWFIVTLVIWIGIGGCSTSRPSTPPTETPVIFVALAQLPPTIMTTGTATQVSATVTSDPANAGVDWTATCGSATAICGAITPAHTDSGVTTTFTAPSSVPPNSTITLTALSSTDHSKFAVYSVTVISTVISVTITQLPPVTAAAGSHVSLAATVVGDPANLGVDWKANCGGVDCTPTGLHSASGSPITFVVPSIYQIPTIVGTTIKLSAYATADHTCANRTVLPGEQAPYCSALSNFQVAPQILIQITQTPPTTMLTNATATLVATVQNDPTNSGVDWSVSCATAPCGTVVPSHTASGAATVFTAPPVVPGNAQNPSPAVTITAQSTASGSSSIQTGTTIVAPISVQLAQNVLNGTIVQGRTTQLIATVTNDTSNAGVDWSCSPAGSCGSFSPAHTSSGATTLYTAPAAIPAGGTATLAAASTADPTKTASQTISVVASPPPNSLLSGQFVMLLTSSHSQNGAYVIGGVISGDGNGTITSATFDLVDSSGNSGQAVNSAAPSGYTIGANGVGQIQLLINTLALNRNFGVTGAASTCGSIPNCGSLTLTVAFVTADHAILSESDEFGTATGTMDLQNLQSFTGSIAPGSYTLSLSGSETPQPSTGYFVGSALEITPTNSYSYTTDQSDGGSILSVPFTSASQKFPGLVSYGYFYSLPPLNVGLPNQFSLHLWPIDATRFVVTDLAETSSSSPSVIIGGLFVAQPAAPVISGTYAFTETGATTTAQPQAIGGILTCGSSGVLDVVPLSGTPLTNQPVRTTCGVISNGRSLISVTGAAASGVNQFAAYPTADQGLYLIELDGGTNGTSGSSGAGVALPQTLTQPITSAALNGSYAASLSSSTASGSQVLAGLIAADASFALTGTADVNSFNATAVPPSATPSTGAGLNGTYTSTSNGRFPMLLTISPGSGQPSPQASNLNLACYLVDANTCMLLDLDATTPGAGSLILQNNGL